MNFDDQVFLFLNEFFSGSVSSVFFAVITKFGNGWIQAAFVVPLMFVYSREKFKQHLIPLALTAALGGLFVAGVKEVVDRPRPPSHFAKQEIGIHTPLGEPVDKSFPSGHTQTAFSTGAYLSCLYPALAPLFLVISALVGLSRIALGVHFPLDVLVGAVLGGVFGYLGYRVNMRRLRGQKSP